MTAVGPHSVRLAWTNPADADLDRVLVRRATGGVPPGSASQGRLLASVDRGDSTVLTDQQVRPGTAYGYAVFAMDRHRNISAPASGVLVRSGQTTALDGRVPAAGAIAGRITAPDGAPLAGVDVTVHDRSGAGDSVAVTDDAGHYLAAGLAPGIWTICFDTAFSTLNFLDECYHDRTVAEGGTPITVTGAALSTADESLAPAATIAGTLTGPGGVRLEGVRVTATAADGNAFDGWTGTDGTYVVRGLPAGTYTVCFDPQNVVDPPPLGYPGECFDDQPNDLSATPVEVALPGVTGIDASFAEAGAITGTVVGTDGTPLAGVFVDASSADGLLFGFAITGDDGTYQMTGLRDGTYTVCFDPSQVQPQPPAGYLPECFDNQPDASTAAPVDVLSGVSATGIDATIASATDGTATDGTATDGTATTVDTTTGTATDTGTATTIDPTDNPTVGTATDGTDTGATAGTGAATDGTATNGSATVGTDTGTTSGTGSTA